MVALRLIARPVVRLLLGNGRIAKEQHASGGSNKLFVPINEYALQQLARDFRNRKLITSSRLREVLAPGAEGKKEREVWHRTTQFLLQ